jgi:hypothetical protein
MNPWYLRGDRLDDLVMLVSRLAITLRKAAPANDLPEKAMDYLKRNGMHGQVLRQESEGDSNA